MLVKWLGINMSNICGYLKVPCISYFQVHTIILCIEHIHFPILQRLNRGAADTCPCPLLQHLNSTSVRTLHLSACLFKAPPSRKAQSALIGKPSQTWAGIAHSVYANIDMTGGVVEGNDCIVVTSHITEVLTACLKAQFLSTGCVHFSVDWVFWYSHSIYIALRHALKVHIVFFFSIVPHEARVSVAAGGWTEKRCSTQRLLLRGPAFFVRLLWELPVETSQLGWWRHHRTFFFFLAWAIIFIIFLSPMDHVMHPHPPCSDVT